MAVVQISRIQHRRGNRDELPESLAEGEIGFAKDTGEIFLGAPNLDKIQYRKPGAAKPGGIFPYSNIRLLTEFDVAYNVSDKVYTQGPLLRGVIAPNRKQVQLKVKASDPIDKDFNFITLQKVIVDAQGNPLDEDSAVVESFRVGPTFQTAQPVNPIAVKISGSDVTVDLNYEGVTLKPDDVVWLGYFAAVDFYEFSLNDADSCILDYSVVPSDPFPDTGNLKPRRAGTIQIIADAANVAVRDQFVDLNNADLNDLAVYWSGRITGTKTDPRVSITCVNAGSGPVYVTFSGRRWNSNPPAGFKSQTVVTNTPAP